MSWRDDRLPASFKGVPFEVESDSQPAGQRTQTHEYPQRDMPFVEPLGKRTNEIRIIGFVSGADCLAKRDSLLEAVNEPGSGELIHPWLGSINVVVTECNYSHSRTAMGVVRFELTFVKSDSEPDFPVAGQDTATLLNSSADGLKESSIGRFLDSINSIDITQVNLAAIQGPVGEVLSQVQGVYDIANVWVDSVDSLYNDVVASPLDFAMSVFGAIDTGKSIFSGFYSRVTSVISLYDLSDKLGLLTEINDTYLPKGIANKSFVTSVRGLMQDSIATDILRNIAVLPDKQIARPAIGSVAVDKIFPTNITQTLGSSDLLVGSMLGSQGKDIPVADDVLGLRDSVVDTFWDLAESSPADHYGSISASRVLATKRLVNVAKQGTVLTTYENTSVMPALVLAYRQYGDAGKTAEIIGRNNIEHPGFLPVNGLRIPRA